MSPPKKPKGRPKKAPPATARAAPKERKPAARHPTRAPLTRDLIAEVRRHLQEGLTKSHAAALIGISKQLLQSWLVTGSTDLEAGEMTLHAELALAVSQGQASYEADLIRWGNESVKDRNMNDRWLRYRLAQSNPKEFATGAAQAQAAGGAGMSGTAFEAVSPSEAIQAVAAKLERFLATVEGAGAADGGR